MLAILLLVASATILSYCFCFWLEDSKPKLFTSTVVGRVAAVAFEQPAIFAIVLVWTLAIPFSLAADYLSHGKFTDEAWSYYLDMLGEARDYYLHWVPTFVTSGAMIGR